MPKFELENGQIGLRELLLIAAGIAGYVHAKATSEAQVAALELRVSTVEARQIEHGKTQQQLKLDFVAINGKLVNISDSVKRIEKSMEMFVNRAHKRDSDGEIE